MCYFFLSARFFLRAAGRSSGRAGGEAPSPFQDVLPRKAGRCRAGRRIVLCGEYSSTCRRVRWRTLQVLAVHRAISDAFLRSSPIGLPASRRPGTGEEEIVRRGGRPAGGGNIKKSPGKPSRGGKLSKGAKAGGRFADEAGRLYLINIGLRPDHRHRRC